MKTYKFFLSLAALGLMLTVASCTVHARHKHDNGKHKGWYKNPNNPHHPASTNPGKAKQKSKGNAGGKGKK